MPINSFDWVTARSACSPAKVFTDLRLAVEQDAKTKNASLSPGTEYSFHVQSNGDIFSVALVRNQNQIICGVDFVLTESGISVRREDGEFEATLTLDDEGQCRLKIDDREFKCWQFRKWALEDLFFGNPWSKRRVK